LVPNYEYNCSPPENPAIPGTQVNLHGVILHETQGGTQLNCINTCF